MLDMILGGLAQQLARTYDGPRDRDTVRSRVLARWQAVGREALESFPEELGAIDDALVERAGRELADTLAEMLVDRGPSAGVEPIELAWTALGPGAGGAALPDPPVKPGEYVLAWDPARAAFVYATSPDYHQFGHAWSYDGAWRRISDATYRLGSAQQAWTGAYDPDRGGVIGWSCDDRQPIGVVIGASGLTVLAAPDAFADYTESPFERRATSGLPDGGFPDSDVEWDQLVAVFGYDRARHVWVALTPGAIWELDREDRWRRAGDLPPGMIGELDGDRGFSRGGAGGVWDEPRRRVVFWMVVDDALRFAAWDGRALVALPSDGLRDELFGFGSGDGAVVGEHPALGPIVYTRPDEGVFALHGERWVASPAGAAAPPSSRATALAASPSGELLIGPGMYSAGRRGHDQHVFYAAAGGAWTQLGTPAAENPLGEIKSSGGWTVLVAAGGAIHAVAWRHSLATLRWDDAAGWSPIVDEPTGEAAFAAGAGTTRIALAAGPRGEVVALSDRGTVYRLHGGAWTAEPSATFGERSDVQLAVEPSGRLVAWTPSATLVREPGTDWRKLPPTPRPSDEVPHVLVFDGALGRTLRFGRDELFVLDGDVWLAARPPRLGDLAPSGRRIAVHDPATGETLLVDLVHGKIVRVDLAGCELVGRLPERDDDEAPPFRDIVFEPASRRLYSWDGSHDTERPAYAIELAPVFALAASLGARTTELPARTPPGVRLYRAHAGGIDAFFADLDAGTLRTRTGSIAGSLAERLTTGDDLPSLARLAEGRKVEGYVTADRLERDAVLRALGRLAFDVTIGKPAKDAGPNRFGGLPSSITAGEWPHDDDGEPLGFLCQLAVPDALGGGGFAVFVKTDGTATEGDDGCTVVIARSAAELARAPGKAPGGVAVLRARPIELGEPRHELDRARAEQLAQDDPVFGELIDAIAGSDEFDKVGGFASPIQGPILGELMLQLDFDGRKLDGKGWDDAGLAGGLYVLRGRGGFEALWQYT